MDSSVPVFRNILAATDFSPSAKTALKTAIATARRCQAKLHVVHVVRDVAASLAVVGYGDGWQPTLAEMMDVQDEYRREGERRLQTLLASYDLSGIQAQHQILAGTPFEEIVRAAHRLRCDLVVAGTRGHSALKRLLVGSTATRLARVCPSATWIVRARQAPEPRSILAPLDFSPASQKSLSVAAALSAAMGAELHLLHVCDVDDLHLVPPAFDKAAADLAETRQHDRQAVLEHLERALEACSPARPSAALHVAQGPAWQMIGEVADKLAVDLIVMGSVGRRGLSGLLIGNTAEKTLHASRHSMLIVKPDGFAAPSYLVGKGHADEGAPLLTGVERE